MNPSIHDLLRDDLQSLAERFERYRRPDHALDVMVLGLLATSLHLLAASDAGRAPEGRSAAPNTGAPFEDSGAVPERTATAPDVPDGNYPPSRVMVPGVDASPESLTLVRGDGQPSPARRNLAKQWAGGLPSLDNEPRREPPSVPLVPANEVCDICRAPYSSHPANRNAPLREGRPPVLTCDRGMVYLH